MNICETSLFTRVEFEQQTLSKCSDSCNSPVLTRTSISMCNTLVSLTSIKSYHVPTLANNAEKWSKRPNPTKFLISNWTRTCIILIIPNIHYLLLFLPAGNGHG